MYIYTHRVYYRLNIEFDNTGTCMFVGFHVNVLFIQNLYLFKNINLYVCMI